MKFFVFSLSLFFGFQFGFAKTTKPSIPKILESKELSLKDQRLTIMTYNVENLFDTKDDPTIEDEAYLPLAFKKKNYRVMAECEKARKPHWVRSCKTTDWTEKILKRKMERLADVIKKSNHKKGPDILIVQEIENREVLEDFRKKYLSKIFTQPAILIEGPDSRGIDVGILTRLPQLAPPQLHELNFKPEGELTEDKIHTTRGILEAKLKLPDGSPLHVFGVHFPSQGSPTPARKQALAKLKELLTERSKTSLAIAGGDFNIASAEEASDKLYGSLKNDFLVSHLVGCNTCKGTNYYHPKRSWSFLDALIFSKNFDGSSHWSLDKKSIHIFNKSLYQINQWGSPSRFGSSGNKKDGVSDHWPILAEIYYSSTKKQPLVLKPYPKNKDTNYFTVIKQGYGKFLYCYEQLLQKEPDASGKLNANWVIDTDGKVKNAQIKSIEGLENQEFLNCMKLRVQSLKFKGQDKPVVIHFPFNMYKQSKSKSF